MLTRAADGAHDRTVSAPGSALVAAEHVSISFRGKPVLENVGVAVHEGEIVTLIGPNGAGKTTLARVLLGLVAPTSGRVLRRAGLTVGYVPQRFPVERIMPLSVRRFMHLNAAISKERALECLAETGAASLADAQMTDLSGGEFQRVLLARALAREPDLLVLDEPARAVDFAGAAQLYDLIASIRARRRCGVLLISHDLHVVLGASDRVVCLNRHICCEGVPQHVAAHPEYMRLFGPEAAASLGIYGHRHDHRHTLSGDICGGGGGKG
ncbi:ATP-binding cassette domain-containing protein [Rhodomicrobium sp. Az07]|uniref:ATP-binding cassette domain-containing protein n=1 Tax=Rhodomicrobium sp. Az07 TaxID=2839034 RepID=UPI001BEC56CB|nr:ATP-binding cassette domain-containing protein [Rhodomicrobium sp. Az07]MBT3071653.1 ATP-binding cassette domain-containing protein [Rhodomicrobium sp. Az07]